MEILLNNLTDHSMIFNLITAYGSTIFARYGMILTYIGQGLWISAKILFRWYNTKKENRSQELLQKIAAEEVADLKIF